MAGRGYQRGLDEQWSGPEGVLRRAGMAARRSAARALRMDEGKLRKCGKCKRRLPYRYYRNGGDADCAICVKYGENGVEGVLK